MGHKRWVCLILNSATDVAGMLSLGSVSIQIAPVMGQASSSIGRSHSLTLPANSRVR